jgi:hypothetical protein
LVLYNNHGPTSKLQTIYTPDFNFIVLPKYEILAKGDGGEVTSGAHEKQQQATTRPTYAHIIN